MIAALKLFANLQKEEHFIEVGYERAAGGRWWRHWGSLFTEVDTHKALVSVRLWGQHRVVKELVGHKIQRGGPHRCSGQ